MKTRRPSIGLHALLWFGVFGAPAAWTAQHVTGYGLTEVACSGHDIALDAWTIAVTALAATVAVLAEASAILVYRATRDAGDEPPGSRVHFLSIVGITVGPLFLAIILMSGLGSVFLAHCHQS